MGVRKNQIVRFWRAYQALSERGRCDAPNGVEYHRVLREWVAAGQPVDITPFILKAVAPIALPTNLPDPG